MTKNLRIIAKVVENGNHDIQLGCLCIDINEAMATYDGGFVKMKTIGRTLFNYELAEGYMQGKYNVVNGVLDTTNNCMDITDCKKGEQIIINERRVLINECPLISPLMVVGRVFYSKEDVRYRVVNSVGVVSELTYAMMVDMVKRGKAFVNIKTTFKNGRLIVSSIKGELPTRKVIKRNKQVG